MKNNPEPRAKIGDVVIINCPLEGGRQATVKGAQKESYGWVYTFEFYSGGNYRKTEQFEEDILKNLTTGKEYGNE